MFSHMTVMKFGGSSVANAERIKHVASIIKAYKDKKPVVVLSAFQGLQNFMKIRHRNLESTYNLLNFYSVNLSSFLREYRC